MINGPETEILRELWQEVKNATALSRMPQVWTVLSAVRESALWDSWNRRSKNVSEANQQEKKEVRV